MTKADREKERQLRWGVIKWIILAPMLFVALVIALLTYAAIMVRPVKAQEAPQVVIICQLSKDPVIGVERIRLFRARSHAHCYRAVDGKEFTRAYPTTLSLPGDGGRLLALCGKDLVDCPELP